MSREQITIVGTLYNVPNRYTAGHSLTEGEADALNQTYHENIRNNLAKQAKDGSLTQDGVDKYANEYVFGVRRAGSPRVTDPVQARALKIAIAKVRAAIEAKGWKVVREVTKPSGEMTTEQLRAMAADALTKKPQWVEMARQQIAAEEALDGVEIAVGDLVDEAA